MQNGPNLVSSVCNGMSRRTSGQRRRTARVAVTACVGALLLFGGLAAAAAYNSSWDGHLRQFLLDGMPEMPGNDNLVNTIIAIAGALLAVLAVATLLLRKLRRAALFWVLAIGGALALDLLLKRAIERPSLNEASSAHIFPSGHAMLSLTVVMACVLTAPTRWRSALAAAGALFLLAYGGLIVESQAHYPSDVVAGWSVSFAWTAALWLLLDIVERGTPSTPQDGSRPNRPWNAAPPSSPRSSRGTRG